MIKIADLIMILMLLFLVYSLLLIQAYNNNSHVSTKSSHSLIDTIGIKQFFNCDIGDGIRVEIVSMLRSLDQSIMVAGGKGNKSPYKEYFENNNGIHGNVKFPSKYNHNLFMHNSPNKNLYEDDIKKMFQFYKADDSLSSSDAIICSHPFSMCEAFMPYNRTIIWIASHRYSLGRCSVDSWKRLNEHVIESMKDNKNRPRNFIAAMSKYDVEYINYFTGLTPILIEPTGSYALEIGKRDKSLKAEILLGSTTHLSTMHINSLMKSAKLNNYTVAHPHRLYGKYKLEQVKDHSAVIIIPQTVHGQTFVEFYALGIPIFIPSIEFLISLSTLQERTTSGRENCLKAQDYDKDGDHIHIKTSEHIHHHAVHDKNHNISHITSTIYPEKSINSRHSKNPESDDPDQLKYWLKFSNHYYWPHVTYFNSFEELFLLIKTVDLNKIRNLMIVENEKRLSRSINSWIDLVTQIEKGRVFPKDYEQSIQILWNVDKLQIE
jgi:hypothetical protein